MSMLGVIPGSVLGLLLLLYGLTEGLFRCQGPEDTEAGWPTLSALQEFGNQIQGSVVLPGSAEYDNATIMINTVFNSLFGAVVYPETVEDVQKALMFAKQHGLRPTISSSTHSFLGRSSGSFTLHISMKKMKQLDVNTNDPESDTGYSIRLGTGNSWFEVYTEVDKYNLLAVGGSAHTVSPGGWTLGGGHSPVTRMKGLGTDNTLEFTMVTADGSIVTVTESGGTKTNTDGSTEALNDGGDLWWSVLGGGGGTYGIVTQLKLKLHEPPAQGFIRLNSIFIIHTDPLYEQCHGVAAEALQMFYDKLGSDLSNNWGGYILVNSVTPDDPGAGTYGGTINFFVNRWGGSMEEAREEMRFLTEYRTDCQYGNATWTHFPTFLDYEKTAYDQLYYRLYMIGTLIQVEDLEEDKGLAQLLASIEEVHVDAMTCLGILVGGASETMPFERTSVSPDLRTARIALGCAAGWGEAAQDPSQVYGLSEFGRNLYMYGQGVYYNEADYFLRTWKSDFWGGMERYNRLLRTKQKWDPDNMFWCHHCVGSDLIYHNSTDYCKSPYNTVPADFSSAWRAFPELSPSVLVLLTVLSYFWR